MFAHLIALFAAGFATVFLLGFQSRNVNTGQYWAAACTSTAIGLAQVYIWGMVTAPSSGFLEGLVYGLSGACGITSSMWVHKRLADRRAGK